MIKVKCFYGHFTVDGGKLTINKSQSAEVIESIFKGYKKIPIGGPSAGDPDMVLVRRMLKHFPASGKIIEYKPPEYDPDIVY